MALPALVLFLLGSIFASLVGLIAGRMYTGAPLAFGRSRCDSCGHVLGVADLVPVFSWLTSQGRCRHCSSRVSPSSTIGELILGFLFVLAYFKLGLGIPLVLFCGALVFILGIVLYDLAHSIIPPVFLVPLLVLSLGFYALQASATGVWLPGVLVALVIGAILALIHFGSGGRAMGLADTPFALALALLTVPVAFSGFVFSFWVGGVVGILILLRTPVSNRMGIEVPFAPFLAAGFLLAYFSGWDPFSFVTLLLTPTFYL